MKYQATLSTGTAPGACENTASRLQWLPDTRLAEWDAFVMEHPSGWLCHLSGWKRAVEKTFPHIRGRIAAITNEVTGRIEAGLPAYHVKSPLTGSRIVSAPFATLFDPLVSYPGQIETLLKPVLYLYKDTGSARIELRTLHTRGHIPAAGFSPVMAYKLHWLDLRRPADELLHTFSRTNVRQSITKARKAQLRAVRASAADDLRKFYSLYMANRQHLGLPALPLSFFRNLWDEFGGSGGIVFMLALQGDQPVSALMGLQFNGRFSVDYLGWDRNFKGVSPSPFLLWEAIQQAYAAGCTVFDFGRTSVRNESLLKFKRHWALQEADLIEFHHGAAPQAAERSRESSLEYRLIKFAAHNAPAGIYRALSTFCYRHLG